MSTELVAETIERWAELRREYESAAYPQGVDRVRNWLFGAGMALQLLDDDKLFGLSRRALEASMNEHISNNTVGAGNSGSVGTGSVESQRPDLADEGA